MGNGKWEKPDLTPHTQPAPHTHPHHSGPRSGILLGVILGVLLNILLPEIIILVFLVCVLSFSSFKTLRKGYSKWVEESKEIEQSNGDVELGQVKVEVGAAEIAPALALVGTAIDTPYGTGDIIEHRGGSDGVIVVRLPFGTAYLHPEGSPEAKAAVEGAKAKAKENSSSNGNGAADERARSPSAALALLEEEHRVQFPLWAYAILCATTLVSIFYGYIKSAHLSPCNGAGYWVFYFTPVPIFAAFLWYTSGIVGDKYVRRKVGMGVWSRRCERGGTFDARSSLPSQSINANPPPPPFTRTARPTSFTKTTFIGIATCSSCSLPLRALPGSHLGCSALAAGWSMVRSLSR